MEVIRSVILLVYVFVAVRGLDNGLARLPPMGWMSWSKFYCEIDCDRHPHSCINEQLYKDMADRMAEDGYLEAGYEYVHIDDCWMASSRSEDDKLVEDKTRFPSGIPALADYINYTTIAKYCNSWRNYNDVTPGYVRSWANVLSIIDWYTANQDTLIPVHGPGQWNDPDMMSLWAIWSAPLIMSNDLRTIDPEFREILLNRRVVAIDQDPLGIMGRMALKISSVYVYVKPVTPVDAPRKRYSYAVAIFNRGSSPATIKFALKDVGLINPDGYDVQELWSGRMGRYMPDDTYAASLKPTSAELLKATLWAYGSRDDL